MPGEINNATNKDLINSLAADDYIFVDDTSAEAATKKFTPDQMQDYVANFADKEVTRPKLKDYSETRGTPSSASGTLDIDLEQGNVFEVTLTENVTTTTFSNAPGSGVGGSLTLILKQNGTGGYTFVWPASVEWAAGTAPTLTTAASAVDILTFITTDAGTTWYGFLAGANFS